MKIQIVKLEELEEGQMKFDSALLFVKLESSWKLKLVFFEAWLVLKKIAIKAIFVLDVICARDILFAESLTLTLTYEG